MDFALSYYKHEGFFYCLTTYLIQWIFFTSAMGYLLDICFVKPLELTRYLILSVKW